MMTGVMEWVFLYGGILALLCLLAVVGVWAVAEGTGVTVRKQAVFREDGKTYLYRVKPRHWLPKLTPWHEDAITPGDTIFCLTDCPPDLEAHEFYHVTRNALYGRVQRVLLILRDYVTRGYFRSYEETAARNYSTAHATDFTGVK